MPRRTMHCASMRSLSSSSSRILCRGLNGARSEAAVGRCSTIGSFRRSISTATTVVVDHQNNHRHQHRKPLVEHHHAGILRPISHIRSTNNVNGNSTVLLRCFSSSSSSSSSSSNSTADSSEKKNDTANDTSNKDDATSNPHQVDEKYAFLLNRFPQHQQQQQSRKDDETDASERNDKADNKNETYLEDEDDDDDEEIPHHEYDNETEILLYQLSPERLELVRSGFSFSCFHSACWLWYWCYARGWEHFTFGYGQVLQDIDNAGVVEFLPFSATLAGCSLAALGQVLFTFYPQRLIGKLTLSEGAPTQLLSSSRRSTKKNPLQLNVYGYSFPFLTLQTKAAAVYPVGQLTLDPTSKDAELLEEEYQFDLSQYQGSVLLKRGQTVNPEQNTSTTTRQPAQQSSSPSLARRLHDLVVPQPELLDIRSPADVPQHELLLQALMRPESLKRMPLEGGLTTRRFAQQRQWQRRRETQSRLRRIASKRMK